MRRTGWVIVGLLIFLTLPCAVFAQEDLSPGEADSVLPIMRPDPETLHRWIEEVERAPKEVIDPDIHSYLVEAQEIGYGTSLSLLNHIQYTPSQRSQGSCGNCWAWAGTGVMEIALDVNNGVKDRLSIQLLDSCKTDSYACCGGSLAGFSNWYGSVGYAIPWANANASYQDAYSSYSCPWASGSTNVSCGSISTAPNYSIASISASTISTTGYLGDPTPIANIKAVLNSNKGIYFGWWMADNTDWNAFRSFWNTQNETAIWNPDSYCGHTMISGQAGGHAVVIVGYNDDDPDPANHYWIVLNSWGTASGNRPNGLFRLKMHMNYNCTLHEEGYGDLYSTYFQTLNITFDADQAEPDKVGVFRNGAWYLDANGNGSWDAAVDYTLPSFGSSGDIPVVGNWNPGAPLASKIGTFRGSNNYWYLDWNGNDAWNGSVTDRRYSFGNPGAFPVVGDWNGNGSTKIAGFQSGWWYLDANGNGTWDASGGGDWSFQFGQAGDIPVGGRWAGTTSYDCVGVFRVVNGQGRWYLDWNCNNAWNSGTDRVYTFGQAGDIAVVGDWNGDGRTKIGVFRSVNGQGRFYLDFNGNGTWEGGSVDRYYTFGLAGDRPVAGRW